MHMAGLRGSHLSSQQHHLWDLQQGQQTYWVQCAISLEGSLRDDMLRLALEDVIRQNEILRTVFHRLPGMDIPVQVINPDAEFAFEKCNLSGLDLAAQQDWAEAALMAVRAKSHDLSSGPTMQAMLLRCAESRTLLLLSLPALCADIPTLKGIIAELARAYMARLQGSTSVDDDVLQYADVSAWQKEILEEDDARLQQTFWTQKDISPIAALRLPFAPTAMAELKAGTPFTPQRVAREALDMPSLSVLEQLGVAPNTFFLACWHILLWRLTGEEGIPLGVACDGRNYEELAGALGPYTRFVPLLAEFAPDSTFAQTLTQMQSSLNRASAAQLYFSWDIMTTLNRQQAGDFFPWSFEFEHWPEDIIAGNIHFKLQQCFGYTERFVLKLVLQQVASTLQWEIQYDAACVLPEQAMQIAHALRTLLQAAPTHLQTPVSRLPIVNHAEQEGLLAAFRGPEHSYSSQTLQQLFEEQAARSPGALAVVCDGQQLTYEQLHVRANRLAHWLQRHGVGPDVLVCLYVERGLDGLIGLLAVLKAGGAYVPLDPDSPPARIAFQLGDTQAPVLLTQEHLLARLPAFSGQVFCLDRDIRLLDHEAADTPLSTTDAENLAYVIYTSGSTGTPKGVLIRQRGAVNYTTDMCRRIAPEPGLHFATVSTLAADLGNTSIFSSLASGGCLHILSYETLTSGETFASYHEQQPIDVLKIVPSHLQALLASCGDRTILPRRYLILGGEALPRSLLSTIQQRGADCSIINHYGPTETTIGALVNELGPLRDLSAAQLADHEQATVPIGYPISNVQICIVDRYQQIVPVGVTGELLISGDGLAAGYLHQAELAQTRFLPHPFSQDAQVHVYKTGDLARYTPDGMVEFIGRADRQVKLRGYRIELGEVEAALRQHPSVREAAAVHHEDRLIAYVVSDLQAGAVHGDLRAFLHTIVPEYMIPAFIMQLPALPLNANGKLDYRALPLLEQQVSMTQVQYAAPRSPIEDILASIWQDVLQTPRIGIHDDFFKAGGHSLLITQVISRIKATLQVNLPIVSLFDAPTVASLAKLVESALHDSRPAATPAITAVSRDQDLPLSFSQERLWFFYQLDSDSTAYNVPFALHLKGKLSVEALEYSLGEVVRRHEILRTTFVVKNGQPLQHINLWSEYHLEQKRLQSLTPQQREDEVRLLRQQEAQRPFNLTQGPLFRTLLLCLADHEEYVLLLTMHHIVSDGWSNGVLLRELHSFYMAHVKNEPAQLAELSIQYADYALWQHHYLQSGVFDTQLRYWRQQLEGIAPLELPTDYPRPGIQSFRGAELNYQLSRDLVDGLKRLSQNEGATLFMTLLASFQVLLARYTGQNDIAVGTPTANRQHAGIEDLIGPFINTLVMRTDLSGNPAFPDLLRRVRNIAIEAYTHQDLPFEKLVEALQPERDLSRTPLFQVLFGLQNMPIPEIDLDGVTIDPYAGENTTAKFDLSLTTLENEQGLLCVMEYSTDLFTKETIESMIQGWEALLHQLLAYPQRRLAELTVMGPAEQAEVLKYSQGAQLAIPQPYSLHQHFEDQVLRTPEAIALICGEDQVSYQELNRRANRLAHHLQAHGIGPESLVALLAEREIHFLVAMLAIFKTGAAYLPLDPLHPVGRLQQIVKDSASEVLLTTHSFAATAESIGAQTERGSAVRISYIEDIDGKELLTQRQSEENLAVTVCPQQLAYVIYTSGSTGTPKGAMVEQEGMLNHLYAKINDLQLTAADSIAQTASQCFDISVWQFLASLLVGGRVAIFPDSISHDPAQLLLALEREGISIYETVPSVLKFLLEAMQESGSASQQLPALRHLLVTGEAVSPTLCQRWLARQAHTPMVNAYGPTECSDDVTHHIIEQPPLETASTVSIGHPVANMQVYILDSNLSPVPARAYGEIYVGGIGVGRGYFGDPQRTAEVFLPDPFSEQTGARLYKTGDRGRYLPDGSIEFIGRIDYQVKIRGFRIELGEIEAHLRRYPGMQDTVVRANDENPEDKYLVAYVVAATTLDNSDLYNFLKERLPNYMVPSAFIQLDVLPLTPNGKVDLQALPVIEASRTGLGAAYQAPRTAVEKILAGLWEKLLGLVQVGVTDNFFELGGHSLLATRAVAQAREVFQIELPLRTLFESPTIASLSHHIEALLHDSSSQTLPALVPVARPERIPLSFAQQRLWFLHQLDPQSSTYTISSAVRLQGQLDRVALDRALVRLIARHESLRTNFPDQQGKPFQLIAPAASTQLHVLDLGGLPREEREDVALRLARQEARQPFDLAHGPLLRNWLLQLDRQNYILLLCMHHIVTDGWSITILLRELTSLYQAFAQGEEPALPALPVQYADYALWQHQWLQGSMFQQQLDYWKRQLADTPALQLPTDHPRPPMQTFRGARRPLWLSSALSRRLQTLSQQEGVTLFMTLLAALQVLLARYSQQWDVAVGTPIANRTREEIEGLVGFFVNTLVLRTDLSGDPSFQELLTRVREVCLGAYAHQDIPFEQVVDAVQVERDQSRSPLFQAMLNFQQLAEVAQTPRLPGLTLTNLELEQTTAKFDLMLLVTETTEGLYCELEYNADLFEPGTISRLLGHWQVLLEAIVEGPARPITGLPLLTEEEREQLIHLEYTAPQELSRARCIHQLFEEQVALVPDRIALSYEEHVLTYQELNARSNQLAHALQQAGVGPEVFVAIALERSPELVVALLAVLKAGGAYIPLDPTYPAEWLANVIDDAQVNMVITQSDQLTHLPSLTCSVLCLDTHRQWLADQPAHNPACTVMPQNAAYMIYTSGSTGRPKGVMVPHINVHRLFSMTQGWFSFGPTDVWTLFHSYAFDFSVWELWGALIYGGRLAVVPYWVSRSPDEFSQLLAREDVSVLNQTPSAFQQLINAEARQPFALEMALRLVIFGGEALTLTTLRPWFERHGDQHPRLINMYGITETTVHVTYRVLSQADLEGDRGSVIGTPIQDLRLYVLDSRQQLVPLGIAGELYVGGAGLATGYWQRADLTAERFVPDPFGDVWGARLYRTGDLVRYDIAGDLEYLGRVDQQVKVRGFRIEPGEIEAVLARRPGIREVVVVVREDIPDDKRLVAYLTRDTEDSAPNSAELRRHVQQLLPEYMRPAAFVFLAALPLTANGKVDRKKLPAPIWDEASPEEREGRKLLSPIEELTMQAWQQVLQRDQLEVEQNFFEVGGHSLLATQIVARLQQITGIEIPLRTLFEAPTIASLSQRIEALLQHTALQPPPTLLPAERPEQIPLSFAQQRLWFMHQMEPESSAYNIPAALRLSGPLSVAALEKSLQHIVQRHENLRTIFISQQGTPMQVIAPSLSIQLPLLDLQNLPSAAQEEQVLLLARQEALRPFDLATGPLLRVYMLRLGQESYALLFNLHHIIADGWSAGVLINELTTLYSAALRDEQASLPALPVQYADYALWQQEWLQGERLHEQLDYWQRQLADVPATLNFPTDRPRPAIQTYVGAQQELMLPAALSQEVAALGQRAGATLFMTLLAGFQVLLLRYSGQHDIVVGTSIANRRQQELEGLIGCFVNTLPLRCDLSGDPSFREVLARIHEVTLQAYAHQDVPFEQLVAQLPLERDLSQQPLFQVAFEFQNFPISTLDMAGVTWRPLEVVQTTAKFDLELTLAPHEQGLRCVLEYNTDLFAASTMRRFLAHFQTLLESIVRAPEQRISTLPLLTSAEQIEVLQHSNQTRKEFNTPSHYMQCLAWQVARTPERIAVCDARQQLTYGALWQRAERLASVLQRRGIGPETLVGLYMDRSCELLISILAIWRCAAAYVPLDPAYPQERLRLILERAQASLLLTNTALQQHLPAGSQRLCLEEIEAEAPTEYAPLAPVQLLPQQLAYVIYTSGSTGVPKGVMINHEGMLNHLWAKVEDLNLDEADVVAQTASQCFDISVWQFLACLLQGGQVHILPDAISHDSFQLLQAVQQTAISILQLVPAQIAAFLDAMMEHPHLRWEGRWLIATGEAMPLSLCQRWWQQQGSIKLLNAYGPTECSDDVTHALLEEQTCSWRVPIGQPVANTQLYILDEQLAPVPTGVVGEIYVGGLGVGRGYLGDVERTATVFVPDPYSGKPSSRLYRTGDRGRYREDGQLEFVERTDAQVKLRGYRIELGEIETVLGQHPQVQQCVVLLRGAELQEKQIVAYVVFRSEPGEDVILNQSAALRGYMKDKLPPYMIPAYFVVLDALPLTANGKVNRERLLTLDWEHGELQEEKEAELLLSPIEELVLQCWKQVLDREQLDVHENFFEVGGHSLLATQVVARLQRLLGIEIPLRTLFEAPTVAELAAWLTLQLRQDQGLTAPAIVPVARNQDLPLSFAQQRLWFQDQLDPGNTAYSIPTAVRLSGRLNRAALALALAAVMRRHEILRTTFPTHEGQPVLRIATSPTTGQVLIDLSYLTPEERARETQRLAQQERQQPFNLASGPLLRCWLLAQSRDEHVLLLTMHHIISDGWSMDILVRELTSLYTALAHGEATDLPALPVQYVDFALWQRQWLQGEVLQQQLDYWKQRLSGIAPLALPTDYPRPPQQTFEGGHLPLHLPAGLSQRLRELSQREGTTLFMTLLAAFNVLLHYFTGQDDLVVGTNVANRNRAETEEVIGFFVNQLVLRTQISGNPSFLEILHTTREVAIGAYVHQDLPFDRLLMELNPERDLSRTPLFQVKFSLEHASAQENILPGIQVESAGFEPEVTKFDMFLHIVESEGNLSGSLEYRTDLFRVETIARLLHLFEALLATIVASPETQLDSLETALTTIDMERKTRQESERRQKNVQKLGQTRRRVNQQVEPQ
ncbi:hypothetical protein KSC_090980 [Ktedonobacter sp. SOSP1-52]|uniref:non-ribosomal peptide synthetase n=1 Tax=Ktedonobacter sp. SOSP1-52 TaxID=2778366 RepID=UPI00191686C2|nr:non-ribosomal peptide synthase/polyketide synthase [Ktedonobacter sp. SOSP1-52]GHO70206.1 hypothetical protein KSC_090980 [Ktedonobacter sp. SOSP1-52]